MNRLAWMCTALGIATSSVAQIFQPALLARRNQGMESGEAASHGMGLQTSRRWGVFMVHHGGDMPGNKTGRVVLPDAGVGIALLTNSELGTPLLAQPRRRLVEMLYGARPEVSTAIRPLAAVLREGYPEAFSTLVLPPDPAIVAKLADRYDTPSLVTST